ncbi:hypothetical protein SAMN04487821_12761 [Enterococcus malodoratus]|uniref:hypothetical protein n=1 Tax=Enterococcus malodoratus TaxID=71451 RepID=UPI0008D2312E|nr:hypothetical protein SAMN04487821_12761 [Enterococcus malodoratus]
MTEKEYKEHIQHTHNAYCRIVIRHASIDAVRMLFAKWKREISLEYLSEEKFMPFSTAGRHIQLALHQIRREIEVITHEQVTSLRNDCKGA